jgi:hypothetical protein
MLFLNLKCREIELHMIEYQWDKTGMGFQEEQQANEDLKNEIQEEEMEDLDYKTRKATLGEEMSEYREEITGSAEKKKQEVVENPPVELGNEKKDRSQTACCSIF